MDTIQCEEAWLDTRYARIELPKHTRMSYAEVGTPKLTTSLTLIESKQGQGSSTVVTSASDSKPKKKICCACPETKKLRDECIVEHGEGACSKWIEAHLQCLRAEGFKV